MKTNTVEIKTSGNVICILTFRLINYLVGEDTKGARCCYRHQPLLYDNILMKLEKILKNGGEVFPVLSD